MHTIKDAKMIRNSVRKSTILANALVGAIGVLMVVGGVWIVIDRQETNEMKSKMMQKETKEMRDVLKDCFSGFYSLFSSESGWLNLGCVIIGIGSITFVISFFGIFDVHSKSICLLISYIILLIIGLVLQMCTAMILYNRGSEMKAVNGMITTNYKLSSANCYEKMIFFLLTGSFNAVVIILLIVLGLLVRHSKTDGFNHLERM